MYVCFSNLQTDSCFWVQILIFILYEVKLSCPCCDFWGERFSYFDEGFSLVYHVCIWIRWLLVLIWYLWCCLIRYRTIWEKKLGLKRLEIVLLLRKTEIIVRVIDVKFWFYGVSIMISYWDGLMCGWNGAEVWLFGFGRWACHRDECSTL